MKPRQPVSMRKNPMAMHNIAKRGGLPQFDAATNNQYAAIAFTQGPRVKHTATQQFEKLIKNILQDYQQHREIVVSYNTASEMLVTANGTCYNLTTLLKYHPDFEQFEFDKNDIAIFDSMTRDPKTVFKNIEIDQDVDQEKIKLMKAAFPDLSTAEMSAIRAYTDLQSSTSYFILKYHAQKHFPRIQDSDKNPALSAALDLFAKSYDPDYKVSDPDKEPDYDYNADKPSVLAGLIRETLVNTAMASFAVSKNTQDEIKVCVAATKDDVYEHSRLNTSGISIALYHQQDANEFHVCLISYGLVSEPIAATFNLNELLKKYIVKEEPGAVKQKAPEVNYKDGIGLSEVEYQAIMSQLNSAGKFSTLADLPEYLHTKLMDILISQNEIAALTYENIYHVEEDPGYYINTFIPGLEKSINTPDCYVYPPSFCSTSSEILEDFFSQNVNVVVSLINPVAFGKNIQLLSKFEDEKERLLVPRQQTAFTRYYTKLNTDTKLLDIYLEGFPVRSLDGVDDLPPEFTGIVSTSSAALFTKPVANEEPEAHPKIIIRLK